MSRTVIRRSRPEPNPLDSVPNELHEALLTYSRAVLAADEARRALSIAAAEFPVRMHELESIARRL